MAGGGWRVAGDRVAGGGMMTQGRRKFKGPLKGTSCRSRAFNACEWRRD